MTDIAVRLPIRLGQFLKLANLAESGSHARELIESGQVSVNNAVCTQRGKQLDTGDRVSVHGETLTVASA
ncbi:RNA-binding S4 domain-containing protein [Flaviflexus equikiangi]|uniref:RNA-binding S4 domain-containing protein n=1 Tax=Flaviflexus equikiangi TaxID=2758573 RepID=A0ABS2TET5_9ACTO|nr:RNA-binding S4 domain-containing protein [Flaviflexus equikiangi]MBM9433170.1 RNA-binding S4 domain-containing protein [Flaviflexus equikiangi]